MAKLNKYDLYETSVQNPEADVAFISRVFKKENARLPLTLREDFCGTAKLCACWLESHKQRTAVGIDIDEETIGLAHSRNEKIFKGSKRIQLLLQDVRLLKRGSFDVACAFNFSYFALKTREEMLTYFKAVLQSLSKDGAFFLDIHGGTETFAELEETTKHKGFTYVWQQAPYDAINGMAMRYIHFRFKDGSQMYRAFSYDWRMWTLPEIKDLLAEAGFKKIRFYWEGSDAKGKGNGVFREVTKAENEAAWVAYIVGFKQGK